MNETLREPQWSSGRFVRPSSPRSCSVNAIWHDPSHPGRPEHQLTGPTCQSLSLHKVLPGKHCGSRQAAWSPVPTRSEFRLHGPTTVGEALNILQLSTPLMNLFLIGAPRCLGWRSRLIHSSSQGAQKLQIFTGCGFWLQSPFEVCFLEAETSNVG